MWKLLDRNLVAPGYPKFIGDVYPGMDDGPPDAAFHRPKVRVQRKWYSFQWLNERILSARTYLFKVWSIFFFGGGALEKTVQSSTIQTADVNTSFT